MKYILMLLATLSTVFAADPAAACTPNTIGDACDTQIVQNGRPDNLGRKAATTIDMVCLTTLASKPSALVLATGRVKEGEAVTGKVLTSWRMQASKWKRTAAGFVREICIPAKLIKGVMTLCNDENRSVWSEADTAYLKRVKRTPSDNPACLLGSKGCRKLGL